MTTPQLEFGETLLFRRLRDPGVPNDLEAVYREGAFVGIAPHSNESLIGVERGIVKWWRVRHHLEGRTWQ